MIFEDEKEEEKSNILDLSKIKSFKQKVPVMSFYGQEAEKFVKEHDDIEDIMEFMDKNLEIYFSLEVKRIKKFIIIKIL